MIRVWQIPYYVLYEYILFGHCYNNNYVASTIFNYYDPTCVYRYDGRRAVILYDTVSKARGKDDDKDFPLTNTTDGEMIKDQRIGEYRILFR